MKNSEILKRLYKDYTKKYLNKMFLALIFAIVLAGSTSSVAYLLDPAIEKIFLNKDTTLILVIPFLIILAFSAKGISLYGTKVIMIRISEEIRKALQMDMMKALIKADTHFIEKKHSGKIITNLINDVNFMTGLVLPGGTLDAKKFVFWVKGGAIHPHAMLSAVSHDSGQVLEWNDAGGLCVEFIQRMTNYVILIREPPTVTTFGPKRQLVIADSSSPPKLIGGVSQWKRCPLECKVPLSCLGDANFVSMTLSHAKMSLRLDHLDDRMEENTRAICSAQQSIDSQTSLIHTIGDTALKALQNCKSIESQFKQRLAEIEDGSSTTTAAGGSVAGGSAAGGSATVAGVHVAGDSDILLVPN